MKREEGKRKKKKGSGKWRGGESGILAECEVEDRREARRKQERK